MTDYFALFSEPRRPWLDAAALQQKFIALSAPCHPDKIHGASVAEKAAAAQKFAELNAAYHCLTEPCSRLRHLLELETGVKPKEVQPIPSSLADLFTETAAACREADRLLAEKNRSTSPLLRVRQFEQAQEWIERVKPLQVRLATLHEKGTDELKSLDAAWRSAGTDHQGPLIKLEELYRLFSYLGRWNRQIQERIVQLSL
jgi:DnaJ-domain-containing protein 1